MTSNDPRTVVIRYVEAARDGMSAVTNVVAEGDQVVAEWTSRATARNGRSYRNRNAGIFTVHDGKIVSVREYTDTQHAAQVLFPG